MSKFSNLSKYQNPVPVEPVPKSHFEDVILNSRMINYGHVRDDVNDIHTLVLITVLQGAVYFRSCHLVSDGEHL